MAESITVPYSELLGSPVISISKKEMTIQRNLICAWDDYKQVLVDLFRTAVGGIALTTAAYPDPWFRFTYVDRVQVKPFFDDLPSLGWDENHVNRYSLARIDVDYKSSENDPSDQPQDEAPHIITRKITFGGEMMSLPSASLVWDGVAAADEFPVNPDVAAGKFIPITNHHLTLHQVRNVPWDQIRNLIGKINSGVFEGAAPETLMFTGVNLSQSVYADGQRPWEIELTFSEKRIHDGGNIRGWNHFMMNLPGEQIWKKLKTKEGGSFIYETGNFSPLLYATV